MPDSKVAIVTDSTVNFPKDILEQYPLTILPLTLIWGDDSYRDSIDITPNEFYEKLQTAKIMPSTSQVTPVQFSTAFQKLLEQGYKVLCIVISSRLSGTMDSAIQAKVSFPDAKIELFDSRSTSLGMGFQILAAARAAKTGATMEECLNLIQKVKDNSGLYFCVDTLEFLHRGGRIGAATRFLGTALNLKPILELQDGEIIPIERVRTQRKALDRMVELVDSKVHGKSSLRLGILDAKAPEGAEYVYQQLSQRFQAVEIIRGDVSPVIGTHAGPGTIGIAYTFEP